METITLPIDTETGLSQQRKSEALLRGEFFLNATLEEMKLLRARGVTQGPDRSVPEDFFYTTRLRYEQLVNKKTQLENRTKTLNPIKQFANIRVEKLFQEEARLLYLDTKTTSERVLRELVLVSPEAMDIQSHDVSLSLTSMDSIIPVALPEWDGTDHGAMQRLFDVPQYEVGLFDMDSQGME